VHAADADPNNDEPLKGNVRVSDIVSTYEAPLIVDAPVTAPARPLQQQDGKLRCCSRIVEFIAAMAAITPVSYIFLMNCHSLFL